MQEVKKKKKTLVIIHLRYANTLFCFQPTTEHYLLYPNMIYYLY